MTLGRAPIPCVDAPNPIFDASGVVGTTNELKAGVIVLLRTDGYPDAVNRYSGLIESIAIGSPQPTFPSRISGRTPIAMAYDPVAGAGGPALVWGTGESGPPWNDEDIPDSVFPRRDGPGFVFFTHRGNNGQAQRTIGMRWCSGYDFTGFTESGVTLVPLGGVGEWDAGIVADAIVVWLPDGTIKIFYRGGTTWNTNAQIGLAEAVWDGAVTALPTFTKYAGNPVIPANAQPWLSTGAAPGGAILEPDATAVGGYRINLWVGARISSNGYGHADSDDMGLTFSVSATALGTPVSPQTSLGDVVFSLPSDVTPQRPNGGAFGYLYPGAHLSTTDLEGRNVAYIPYERDLALIASLGRFYPANGQPYTEITATASGGGVQQYTASMRAGWFCKPVGDRSVELATLFQQGDSASTDHCYDRINPATGVLDIYWRTATRELTLSSAASVDDAIPHKYLVVETGGNQLHLFLEREGKWTLEASSSVSSLGTFTGAVNIGVGNAPSANADYGNHPFLGAIREMAFASGGSPPTEVNEAAAAAEGLLDPSRTVPPGVTFRWALPDGTDTGDVVYVEADSFAEVPTVSADGSAAATDPAGARCFIPGADGQRLGVLCLAWKDVATGLSAVPTIDGVDMTPGPVRIVGGTRAVAIYYALDAALPDAAGFYDWDAGVDGPSGEVEGAFLVIPGRKQSAPYDTGGADGTGASLGADIDARAGSVVITALYNESSADAATPYPTQTEIADFSGSPTGPRLAASWRPAFVDGTFDVLWSDLTNAEQHILVAAAWEAFDASSVGNAMFFASPSG